LNNILSAILRAKNFLKRDPKDPREYNQARLNGPDQDKEREGQSKEDGNAVCCGNKVHIAYRGLSDDRLYLAHDRTWQEVKFYKPHGLKVFCCGCRRRLL
jgi:hypothetical protein